MGHVGVKAWIENQCLAELFKDQMENVVPETLPELEELVLIVLEGTCPTYIHNE